MPAIVMSLMEQWIERNSEQLDELKEELRESLRKCIERKRRKKRRERAARRQRNLALIRILVNEKLWFDQGGGFGIRNNGRRSDNLDALFGNGTAESILQAGGVLTGGGG